MYCVLLMLPRGFIPSVEKPSRRFLASLSNSENFPLNIFQCKESARCCNILSIIVPSECHIKLFAYSAFLNMRLNLGIIGKCHNTLAGDLSFILYRDLSHTGHFSKCSYSFRNNTIIRPSMYLFIIHTHRAHDFFGLIRAIWKFIFLRKNIFQEF